MATPRTAAGWTQTQQRIIDLLSDGQRHHRSKLLEVVDEQADVNVLSQHLTKIRAVLRPRGEDIVCETTGWTSYYRHVRLLRSSSSE